MLIARISKGRTVREFLLGVIIIPTLFSMLWFSVFGTLSCDVQIMGANLAALPTEQVLFGTFSYYPAGTVLSMIAVVLVFSFFITSADSATFVLTSLSENGNLTPHRRTKVVWGVLLALIAAILPLAGGLQALNNILMISALPFSIVMALMCISLYKELMHERLMMGLYLEPKTYPDKDRPFRSYESPITDDDFRSRIIQQRLDNDTPGPFMGSTAAQGPNSASGNKRDAMDDASAHGSSNDGVNDGANRGHDSHDSKDGTVKGTSAPGSPDSER